MADPVVVITYKGVRYLSPAGARALYAVSKATVYNWWNRGKLQRASPLVVGRARASGLILGNVLFTEESLKEMMQISLLELRSSQ